MGIAQHIAELPPLLQAPVERWAERLAGRYGSVHLPDERLADVVRVAACSEFAAGVLLREWAWFAAAVESMDARPSDVELNTFVSEIGASDSDAAEIKMRLRRFRHRVLLRLIWREILGRAELDETLHGLSVLADRLLDAAARFAARSLNPRFGQVLTPDGDEVPLVIIGMGKLGGRELNFSSDIDLIFCYAEAGQTDGKKSVSAQEYFGRLSRDVVALIDERTEDGFAFRIDTRLRPFGDSGPPVVSFAALESYLLQHGRDWERYAYVKARVVGPQPPKETLEELDSNLIRPFVYRRYLDYGVFESLREMHSMIAAEVRRRELADNVKLGPGGIREIEFIVQTLQLVRGGSEPALQSRSLQTVLPKLVSHRGLSRDAAAQMRRAYRFLRRVENFIQAIRDEQTHVLPERDDDRCRLCLAMGFRDWAAFTAELQRHRDSVAHEFANVAFRGRGPQAEDGNDEYERLWEAQAGSTDWARAFGAAGDDAAPMAEALVAFAASTRQLDAVARQRLQRFLPALLAQVVDSDRPLVALQRCLAVVARVLRRSAYVALLNENRPAMLRLVELCERSSYIADQIARHPLLLDELLDPRTYTESVTYDDIAAELALRLDGTDDIEAHIRSVAQFQRATMFRIAVADFNGHLPIMKVSDGLTWLAEAVLAEALRTAWDDLSRRHGVPQFEIDGERHEAGFAVIAYGKLGGLELSYGSDLDIVFLHDSRGTRQTTNGEKPLDNTMFFGRLVRRLVHFLTTQTGFGALYEIDTRLRPEGRSGLLVTSLNGFERYQVENAWTWEHQALLRARPVAGDATVADEFSRIREQTLRQRIRRDDLRHDVTQMRERMRGQLDRSDADTFDLKHGRGGIGDIEFLVQYLVLRDAERYPALIEFSDNIRQLDALVDCGVLEVGDGRRLQDVYRTFRLCVHHRVLDDRAAVADAGEFTEQRQFVIDQWSAWLG